MERSPRGVPSGGVERSRAEGQLRLIVETAEIAETLGAEIWLRGGWAVDFFLGEVTRDHEDIDWFAWSGDAPGLVAAMVGRGYARIPGPPPDQQVDLAKDGLESSVCFVNRDEAGRILIAGGPWSGEPWPEAAAAVRPGRIGSVACGIVDPLGQIANKVMMPVWVPGRPRRAKDADDIARLRAALDGGPS